MVGISTFSGYGLFVLSIIVMGEICRNTLASPDLSAMVENGESYGLSEVKAQALWSDLSQPEARITEHARKKIESYASQGVDMVPFLLGLRELGPELGKEGGPSQSTVVLWLALTHDQRANEHLLATYRELLRNRTRQDPYSLSRMTYSLGLTKSEAAVDLLLEVQSDEFWQNDSTSYSEQTKTSGESCEFDEQAFIMDVRGMAMSALANTGSDRAIRAFGAYEGINRSRLTLANGLFRVAIESKDTLPDVEKWREEGLPEHKLSEMQNLVEWWQNAETNGVALPHAKVLRRDLEQLASEALVGARKVYYRENGVDIVPFLIHLVESGNLSESGAATVGAIAEGSVLFWIAAMGGEASGEYLLNRLQKLMKGPITSRLELQDLQKSIHQLGMSRYEPALDYLFKVQGDEFWEGADAPVIELSASARQSAAQEIKDVVKHLQMSALQGFAVSGTERAIHAFGTGEGVNPAYQNQLDRLFETAARSHFDIVGMPEWYGQPLPEETLKGLQDLYAKYGKIYVPEKTSEKIKQMSTPH